jgi:predicted RNase H-like HicB family nuclease
MLIEYIQAAMRHATYKPLNDGTYFGEIAALPGLWGNGPSLESCREDLLSALQGWIILGLRMGDDLPIIDGINLTPPLVEENIDKETPAEAAA